MRGSTHMEHFKEMRVEKMLDPLCDLELWPWHKIFKVESEKAISQEWEDWLTWNERDVRLWVNRKSDSLCEFEFFPHPWPWPWTIKANFWKSCGWVGRLTWNEKMSVDRMLNPLCDLELWPWPWIFKVKFWKNCIPGVGWPIDMEWKGCESNTMLDPLCILGLVLWACLWAPAAHDKYMSNGLMQNCYSFHPVSPLMSCLFSDLWAECCFHSLNALSVQTCIRPSITHQRLLHISC